eukprot:scpid82496/ scgid4258/ 
MLWLLFHNDVACRLFQSQYSASSSQMALDSNRQLPGDVGHVRMVPHVGQRTSAVCRSASFAVSTGRTDKKRGKMERSVRTTRPIRREVYRRLAVFHTQFYK